MRTIVKGKNIDVADADLRTPSRRCVARSGCSMTAARRCGALARAAPGAGCRATIVEVTLVIDGRPLRSVGRGVATCRAAVDEVVRQARAGRSDHKERPRERGAAATATRRASRAVAVVHDADRRRPARASIVKVKRFAIEPTIEADASESALRATGISFSCFVNA